MSVKIGVGVLTVLLAVLFACIKKELIISIDDWWNVDYSKNACELRKTGDMPCVGDPVPELRDFEARMNTFFATDAACRGVALTNYQGPRSKPSKAASEPYSNTDWSLTLDFHAGESSH